MERVGYNVFKEYIDKCAKTIISDGGLGEYYLDEEGNKVGWREHGFASSEYFIALAGNQGTLTIVNMMMNK